MVSPCAIVTFLSEKIGNFDFYVAVVWPLGAMMRSL